ncbi:hypothetical protein FOMPIDRAFT_1085622, partial [Fomitopsis schrenkii]
LRGPPSPSWLFGVTRTLAGPPAAGLLYERWAEEYGSVYSIPCELGQSCVVLCDPKAIQHFYACETREYVHTTLLRTFVERILGRSLFWAEGETHRRHKKLLAPAFRPAAVKDLLPIVNSSALKFAAAWDQLITPNRSPEIDVRDWYDTIGSAGVGLDFGTLRGRRSGVVEAINSLSGLHTDFVAIIQFATSLVTPAVLKFPTTFSRVYKQLDTSLNHVVSEVCEPSALGLGNGEAGGRSVIHHLLENNDLQLMKVPEEIRSQLKLLLLTGYVTTANCLTWCLVELCRQPDIQHKLREELSALPGSQLSWERLTNELPYLDAVIHETLRLHPPLPFTTRVAAQDDIIPLTAPIVTASGAVIDQVFVTKGQLVTVPIYTMNTSTIFWGPDAKEFNPDRFLDQERIPEQIPGHRHILTFVHGQRMCPGRHYALAEMKASVALHMLIQNYVFELLDGPGSKVDVVGDMASVPGVPGGDGDCVPLKVRR